MSRLDALSAWAATVSTHLPRLSRPQVAALAAWSFALVVTQSCGLTSAAYSLSGHIQQIMEGRHSTFTLSFIDAYRLLVAANHANIDGAAYHGSRVTLVRVAERSPPHGDS